MILDLKYSAKLHLIHFLSLFFLLASCSRNEKVTPVGGEEKLSRSELEYMTDIMTVDAQMDDFWNGFDCLRAFPIFIITDSDQGIFINPPNSQLAQSRPIADELDGFESLALYRNDEILDFAKTQLSGDRFFAFAAYENFSLYLFELQEPGNNFYDSYKNRNGYFHVSVFYHELFHVYQLIKNYDRYISESSEQNINAYPLTKETLPLLILLFDVMIDAYRQDSESQKLKFLQYYVSIQGKLDQMDTTQNNLIRNHGFHQEKVEGVARYIEVFATLNTVNNNTIEDPTHGYKAFTDNISSFSEVRTAYAFRIFYHTGAGVIHLLKELKHPGLEDALLMPANMPYDVAKAFLDMNQSETDAALEEAKASYDWPAIVSRSEYLLDL